MSTSRNVNSLLQQNPIAIIGVSAAMPDAQDVQEYWQNILDAKNSLKDVPADRWDIDAYYDPDPTVPDKTYCKRGGFLPEIDFDPMEFGLPPNILEVTDVSQMISLVMAKAAFVDAGYYNTTKEIRERTGVVLGVGGGQKLITPLTSRLQYPIWREAMLSSGLNEAEADAIIEKIKKAYVPWEENSFPGMLGNVIAGRIANRFDLGGMNCVVDAACASSLAAFKMAVSDLLEGRSDMMLTGGVDTDNSIFMYMCFSKTPAFSRRENTTPFDADADGMMLGEGIGMVVLKRLDDAVRDGDRIYAVVKGIGVSSDGKFKSIYAPRPAGQALALERAYEDAGFSPATVGLVEAHGTGTAAGDPSEFSGLKQVFTAATDEKNKIALGSVKSQIGHTKSAAGAASLVKVALALHHKVLPPTIGVNEPNPKFGIEETPFYLNTTTRPWIRSETNIPRRAGVSSFGFGGTNFHIVLEEYTADHTAPYRLHSTAQSVLVHAPSPQQLAQQIQQTITQLQGESFQQQFLNLVAESENDVPRTHARLGFVADSAAEAAELLQAGLNMLQKQPNASRWSHPKGIHYQVGGRDPQQKIVALFPGQGSQYLEMGREAALNYPEVREAWGKMDGMFVSSGRRPLSQKVFPTAVFNDEAREEQNQHLRQTENAQPAIGVLSYALYKLLQKAGFQPDYTAGHSFGELTALWAGGVLDDDGYFKLIKARGEAMAPPPNQNHFDSGTMLAVQGNADQVQAEVGQFPQVTLANLNSPNQTILAGPTPAIQRAETALAAKGYRTVNLPVSAAFHTPLVGHAQHKFATAIESVPFHSPRLPVYANATGLPYSQEPIEIRQSLEAQILNPVYFRQQIEHLYRAGGYIFIEIGPKRVLTNLVSEILGDRPHVAIALNSSSQKPDDRQLRDALVQMRVAGLDLRSFDGYQTELNSVDTGKKKLLNVKLTGANHVSEKTRQAYRDALDNGFTIERTVVNEQGAMSKEQMAPPVPVAPSVPAPAIVPPTAPTQHSAPIAQHSPAPAPIAIPTPAPTQHSPSLSEFFALQQESLKVHEQYLQQQQQDSETALSLLEKMSGQTPAADALRAFHQHQAETARIHGQYLQDQMVHARTVLGTLNNEQGAMNKEQMAPPATVAPSVPVAAPAPTAVFTPAPTQHSAPIAQHSSTLSTELQEAMLEVVAEKTGYPAEMLELEMDMEADLGIDSIKRVEILGAMQDKFPNLPAVQPEEMAELRTLAEIVDYLNAQLGNEQGTMSKEQMAPPAAVAPSVPVATSAPVAAPTPAPLSTQPSSLSTELQEAMLEVVAEKTGYPAEMLELEMDMEADLGIDSIKRVEILGAMQDKFPNLPAVQPEEMAELRTLGEIVDYLNAQLAGNEQLAMSNEQIAPSVPVATPAPVAAPTPAPLSTQPSSLSTELQEAMLEVVAEKTGYPAEMLEMEMDMEADLGIDSIKRVEILGAMQDKFPNLPAVQPEEMAELRTLGEIVDYLNAQLGNEQGAMSNEQMAPPAAVAPSVPAPVAVPTPAPLIAQHSSLSTELQEAMLEVVAEKTGYPAEMLEMEMDMEADLGIDSIKRVEILGAMQDKFPNLPAVQPEEMAELRTLGEIVDYLNEQLAGNEQGAMSNEQMAPPAAVAPSIPAAVPAPVAVPTPAPTQHSAPVAQNSSTLSSELQGAMLEVVAEKTGYPAEMLEMEMDMEADLGIDSIKRVEILGAMQDLFPNLPAVQPEEMAELRTLGEIVDYLNEQLAMSNEQMAPPAAVVPSVPVVAPAPVAVSTPAPLSTQHSSLSTELQESMLEVVAEKTGYPAEMLEMEMDMEADLGIDSIKRVEILGAMQDLFPNLPAVQPEEMAELRTLGEIVDYLNGQLNGEADFFASAPASPNGAGAAPAVGERTNGHVNGFHGRVPTPSSSAPPLSAWEGTVVRHEVRLKTLPRPDHYHITLPAGHVAVVTDDGTAVSSQVAAQLQAQGWPVVLLSFPSDIIASRANLPAGVRRVELSDMSEATLQDTLNQLGRVGAFVHIQPITPVAHGQVILAGVERELIKQVFLMAKYLQPMLTTAGQQGFAAFMTVARLDGAFGFGRDVPFNPLGSGLFGLTKSLNLEWPQVYCRAVDISRAVADQDAAEAIVAELYDPNRLLNEAGYGSHGRVTLSE